MKHEILTGNGVPIQLVRYCKYNNNDYLIFTKDSGIDDQGYITIHISQIENENGMKGVAADHGVAKDIVKTISSEVKNNMPLSIIDLNYHDLDGINIIGDQAFRLLPNYVECLETNRINFESSTANQKDSSSTFLTQDTPFQNVVDSDESNQKNINVDSNPFVINQPVNDTSINTNDFSTSVNENIVSDSTDYKKMYLEQAELVKNLNSEIEIYKSKIEMLKNIINN